MIVRERRQHLKLSQEQLAKEVGISRSMITKIELGLTTPSVPVAKKIGEALNIDWPKIFDENRE